MKIEFGFQANCSELVAYLGITTIPEIIEVMRTMEEVTGWTWRVEGDYPIPGTGEPVSKGNLYVRIPMDRLEELLVLKRNVPEEVLNDPGHPESWLEWTPATFGIHPQKLREQWKHLPDDIILTGGRVITSIEPDPPFPILMNIPSNRILHHSSEKLYGLYLDYWDIDYQWEDWIDDVRKGAIDFDDDPYDFSFAGFNLTSIDNDNNQIAIMRKFEKQSRENTSDHICLTRDYFTMGWPHKILDGMKNKLKGMKESWFG